MVLVVSDVKTISPCNLASISDAKQTRRGFSWKTCKVAIRILQGCYTLLPKIWVAMCFRVCVCVVCLFSCFRAGTKVAERKWNVRKTLPDCSNCKKYDCGFPARDVAEPKEPGKELQNLWNHYTRGFLGAAFELQPCPPQVFVPSKPRIDQEAQEAQAWESGKKIPTNGHWIGMFSNGDHQEAVVFFVVRDAC